MKSSSAALTLLALLSACGGGEVAPKAQPKVEPPPPPVASADARAPHAPIASAHGEYFALEDLIGRQIDELSSATCSGSGWELMSGLWVAGRPLAVRRCKQFRGPHDHLDRSKSPGSLLTLISDGGRIVFAVASKEYALEPAQRLAEALLRGLALSGCEQVYSDEHNVGFGGCPGAAGWAAVTRLALAGDGGALHAVVLEVAEDRAMAGQIASAYAKALEQR